MIRLAIRRPVAVTMAYAGIAALGAFAWRNIPLELLPDTQLPRLTVSATWPGTSPETVEAFLTSPLEAVIQQVGGVEKITSDSFEQQGTGLASIEVEFARGSNMDFARLELSERISTLQEDLPPGVGTVAVTPFVPEEFRDQNRPFLSYTLTGPYTLEALRAHVEDVVRPALTELEGVALVVVRGGRARRLEIQLDPEVARSLGLTPEFLRQRIAGLDLVREAGVVREGAREWTVTIANRPTSPQDIVQAVIATAGDKLVRVGDVARVSDTFAEATGYARIDGRPAVTFELLKEIGSNTIEVADRVKVSLAELERRAPHGSRYLLVADESADIRRHFSDLRARAVVSALVIFVVLLAFLRSFASAGIVYATIAFSVLITLNVILLSGLTLNLLTLMGIAMAFGLLVDSCIVVLENTYRRWQQGEEASAAAEGGAREVAGADPSLDRDQPDRVRALRLPPGRAASVLRTACHRGGDYADRVAPRGVYVHPLALGPRLETWDSAAASGCGAPRRTYAGSLLPPLLRGDARLDPPGTLAHGGHDGVVVCGLGLALRSLRHPRPGVGRVRRYRQLHPGLGQSSPRLQPRAHGRASAVFRGPDRENAGG